MMDINVCVVTVTYNNRFNFVSQVIEEVLKQRVSEVVVVDNDSHEESRRKLKSLKQKFTPYLKIITLKENVGSSGFKLGLKYAYNSEKCDFVWLLDDDNLPEKNALFELKKFWNNLKTTNKNQKVMLSSYRRGNIRYKKAILSNNPNYNLGSSNSFYGFNIIDFLQISRRKELNTNHRINYVKKSFGKVYVAPYGGMFFHKSLINVIGYPNERFFLYYDDHEYSHRIIRKGGSIIMLLSSVITDIDRPFWSQPKFPLLRKMTQKDQFRLYYTIRNRILFEKKYLISNNLQYSLNILIYLSLVFIRALFLFRFEYFSIYIKAVSDGLTNKFGKRTFH